MKSRLDVKCIGIIFVMVVILSPSSSVYAQENNNLQDVTNPPVVVKALFGNRDMSYQMLIQKNYKQFQNLEFLA